VSDIVGELARVNDAFDKPTLRLLDRRYSPLVLAVFRLSFSRDQRSVTAERLHAQVDTYLEELAAVGEGKLPPNATGRSLCVRWMKDQWLFRTIGDSGTEEYSLTSHALEALDLVSTLSRERALISESRINTILSAVRRMATEANPDRQSRIDRLDAQIAQLAAERDRLANGGELAAASDDQMVDGYVDILALIGQLPSDFKRVEESVLGMHRQIIADFRNEGRPIADVLDEYLIKTDELTTLTAEGRAFDGAFSLLRDEALLLDLKKDLHAILDHSFADALTPAEQRDFRGAVTVLRRGIDDVLTQRARLSTTLRDHIVNHNIVRDRELDSTLRQINQQLALWMETAGPRASVPLELIPAQVNVEHLRERFYDPDNDIPPPPLEDVSDLAPNSLDLDAIRRQGGPALAQLRRELIDAIEAGDAATVSQVFNALPDDLRRPVEVLGMLHVLAGTAPATETGNDQPRTGGPRNDDATGSVDVLHGDPPYDTFHALRPDGTPRMFQVARRELNLDDAHALAADEGHHR
jgi:Protein of unknown function (DUF3375)